MDINTLMQRADTVSKRCHALGERSGRIVSEPDRTSPARPKAQWSSLPRLAGKLALMSALALSAIGCANRASSPAVIDDLQVRGNATIELTPVHYAIRHLGAARAEAARGGIPSLFDASGADLAGHAETQALRSTLDHPDLRIILTITEGRYRIVAKRSAGIRTLTDLRGKTIATPRESSAAFYLHRALAVAGMAERDVEIVNIAMPPRDIASLLLRGKADAVALWEPEPQRAIERLGEDAIILEPETGYRELYNLNTTAAKLADPATRAKIVRFVATLIQASARMKEDRPGAVALAAETTGYPANTVAPVWRHHAFPATLAPGLLDTLVAEERWLAGLARRPARTRAQLATLIDPSIEAEARALLGRQGRVQ